jgi:hypothetical protein
MARSARAQTAQTSQADRVLPSMQPPSGTVRTCAPYRGETARHRVISADGYDYVVATLRETRGSSAYLTGAYPVSRGYLVMVRQPLYEIRTQSAGEARERHDQLVEALAQAGVRLVRAQRALAARRRAEKREAALAPHTPFAADDSGVLAFPLPAPQGADPVTLG